MTVMTLPDAQQLLAMPDSDYMNSVQRAFFRQLLQDERQKLLLHIDELKKEIDGGEATGDEADKAAREEELRLLFRPTAELSIEAKTAQEMREPHMRKGG